MDRHSNSLPARATGVAKLQETTSSTASAARLTFAHSLMASVSIFCLPRVIFSQSLALSMKLCFGHTSICMRSSSRPPLWLIPILTSYGGSQLKAYLAVVSLDTGDFSLSESRAHNTNSNSNDNKTGPHVRQTTQILT